ncbi:hypothetical protein KEJ27_09920 [Candidatus Bathyarchaeota archaeon]|nr:hypothetical protein [Candidatus Bathyarchaeota archaeon]MBS7617894.1 hypothetical protein [Candidatus Bathyarchaeota archaeon]
MERNQRMEIPFRKTLDNTIYKTRIIKSLGGFPRLLISPGLDIVLNQRIEANGFKWSVNYMTVSIHLRKGLKDELTHYYWYGIYHRQLNASYDLKRTIRIAFLSPLQALHIAVNKRSTQVFYIYPLIRFAILAGALSKREKPPY